MNPLAEDLEHIIDHTRPLWEEVRGEQLFITGGTGFFGCWLLESFLWTNERLNLNARIKILTRHPKAFIEKVPHLALAKPVSLLEGDVRNFVFPDGVYPLVIHAATESSSKLNAENPLLMLDTISTGTRHILDFAASHGTKKMLLTSSGAVYGKQPASLTHTHEEYNGAPDPLDPASAYGQGKRFAEHLCSLYAQKFGLQIKIARCFAFVGPYLPVNAHYAIGNFIRDGLNGGPIEIQGDGTPRRSYLYAADLAIWLWTILFKGQSLRPYNVGSEESISIADLASLVRNQISDNIAIEIQKKPDLSRPLEQYVPLTSSAESELGLRTWISLPKAIQSTLKWNTR